MSMNASNVAVFSINASTVSGALAHISHHGAVTVLAASEHQSAPHDVEDVTHFLERTLDNLAAAIEEIRNTYAKRPDTVFFVLASPWYVSQTRTIHYEKTTPFLCSHSFIQELITKETTAMIAHKELGFETGTIVEQQLSHIRLNGYPTDDPYGKHALTLDMSLTITTAPKQVIDRLADALKRVYGTCDIHTTSAPYAAYIVARDYLQSGTDVMLLDVGPIATDTAFVKDGIFLYQHSFPIGTLDLYRALTADKHTLDEARAIIDAYRLNTASPHIQKSASSAIERFSKEWSGALQGILDNGHFGFSLPEVCYLVSDPTFAPLFATAITNDQFVGHLSPQGRIAVVTLDHERIGAHVGGVQSTTQQAIALLFAARTLYTTAI